MKKQRKYLKPFTLMTIICMVVILSGCDDSKDSTLDTKKPSWNVSEKETSEGTIVEIAYGSGNDFPQYSALYLKDSYFRTNYGPGSGW